MRLLWLPKAREDLQGLPTKAIERVIAKMEWYARQDHPLSFAKRLVDNELGTYRFRVGNYRVICDVEHGTVVILIILAVKHRSKAYR